MKDKRDYKKRTTNTKMVSARVDENLLAAFQHAQSYLIPRYGYFFGERASWLSDEEDVVRWKSDRLKNLSSVIGDALYEQLESIREGTRLDFYTFYQWSNVMLAARDEFLKSLSKEGFEVKKFNLEFSEGDYLDEFVQFVEPDLIFEFLDESTRKILKRWNMNIRETGKEFYIFDKPTMPSIDADTFMEYMKTIEIPEWMSNNLRVTPRRENLIMDMDTVGQSQTIDEQKSRLDLIRKNLIKSNFEELDDDFINDHYVSTQICENHSKTSVPYPLFGRSVYKYIRLSDEKFGVNNRKILVNWTHCDFAYQENYYHSSYVQTRNLVETADSVYSVHHIADFLDLSEQRIIELFESIEITGKTIDSDITKEERSKLIGYLMKGKGDMQ